MQYDLWNIFRKMLGADLLQIVKKRSETKVVETFYLNRELPTVYLLKLLYFNWFTAWSPIERSSDSMTAQFREQWQADMGLNDTIH